ncbi:MAG: CBS domain-containing protein [Anaerolineales bacterium]|nr:CBS domain-containing protein [Anaerolineales bacterium]
MKSESQVTLLVVILHNTDHLAPLLKAWRRIGVPGATILPSAGSFEAENWGKRSGLGNLLALFDQEKLHQRSLLSLIDDFETLELAIAEADRIVKGFDSPQSGILFTVPVGQVLGLQKWGISEQSDQNSEPEEESGPTNRLMQWYEEDVKERYGEQAIADWSQQRKTPVSQILVRFDLLPTIVQVDTPILEVVRHLATNPGMPAACVVNAEERLVGVIPLKGLAEAVMAPVMPDAYINDPQGYEKALNFARLTEGHIAANIMSDPFYILEDETLEQAYTRMKENNLSGLPVVDHTYRVKGFLTLLGLMAICFPKPEAGALKNC